jgi:hypothetical protein
LVVCSSFTGIALRVTTLAKINVQQPVRIVVEPGRSAADGLNLQEIALVSIQVRKSDSQLFGDVIETGKIDGMLSGTISVCALIQLTQIQAEGDFVLFDRCPGR